MKLQEIEMGLLSFAETHIAPNLESDLDRLMFYAGGAAKLAQFEAQINKNAASLVEMNLMDADGEFNLDAIEKYGEIAFAKVPKVSFWKVKGFNQRDFKNLMNYLRHGNEQSPSGDAETGSMDNSI
jgi:hypothetical protein